MYLINLALSRAIRLEVPQALWSGKQPTYNRLHIFGCEAYAFIPRDKRTKLAPHATKCIFLGYGTDGDFGYRLWDPENRKLIRSSDVVFNEDSIFSQRNQQKTVGKKVSFKDDSTVVEGPTQRAESETRQTVELQQTANFPADTESATSPNVELKDQAIKDTAESTRVDKGRVTKRQVRTESTTTTGENNQTPPKSQTEGGTPNKTPDTTGSTNTDRQSEPIEGSEPDITAPRRSGRARRQTEFYQPGLDYVNYTDAGEPSTYDEAMAAPDAETWLQAMKSEMDSIHQNQTWELVELLARRKPLPCKWVFRYKYVSDSEKPKYKARLVAKGFKQEYGVDYDEIFSPVVKMTTLRLLLGVVATEDLELEQMDVKTTFLHGDLEEDIYMSQPAGFTATGEDSHLVCRLKKSLYGLKQAPRMWYQKFDSYIRQLGYNRSDSDPCMYVRQLADESRIYLILYVDDMLIAGSNQVEIGKLKRSLHAKFTMKELGQARHILGMRIERNQMTKTL